MNEDKIIYDDYEITYANNDVEVKCLTTGKIYCSKFKTFKIIKQLQQENAELKGNYKAILKQRDDTNKSAVETIEKYQQENARLKDKIEKSFKIVDDKLTNLNLEYGVNNEFREEYDELWEILKEN